MRFITLIAKLNRIRNTYDSFAPSLYLDEWFAQGERQGREKEKKSESLPVKMEIINSFCLKKRNIEKKENRRGEPDGKYRNEIVLGGLLLSTSIDNSIFNSAINRLKEEN